nr:glutaminase [Kribbella shirazensis]
MADRTSRPEVFPRQRWPFTIMSVAKPFVFALVCQAVGVGAVRKLVGVNRAARWTSAGSSSSSVHPVG